MWEGLEETKLRRGLYMCFPDIIYLAVTPMTLTFNFSVTYVCQYLFFCKWTITESRAKCDGYSFWIWLQLQKVESSVYGHMDRFTATSMPSSQHFKYMIQLAASMIHENEQINRWECFCTEKSTESLPLESWQVRQFCWGVRGRWSLSQQPVSPHDKAHRYQGTISDNWNTEQYRHGHTLPGGDSKSSLGCLPLGISRPSSVVHRSWRTGLSGQGKVREQNRWK